MYLHNPMYYFDLQSDLCLLSENKSVKKDVTKAKRHEVVYMTLPLPVNAHTVLTRQRRGAFIGFVFSVLTLVNGDQLIYWYMQPMKFS